jgi:hypothetical protein
MFTGTVAEVAVMTVAACALACWIGATESRTKSAIIIGAKTDLQLWAATRFT